MTDDLGFAFDVSRQRSRQQMHASSGIGAGWSPHFAASSRRVAAV